MPSTPSTESKTLLAYLNAQRAHVLGILEGLEEEALRRPVLPSGWSCLGLVRHLALDDERFWLATAPRAAPAARDPLPGGGRCAGRGIPVVVGCLPVDHGRHASLDRVNDGGQLATDLAAFVTALHSIPAPDSGLAETLTSYRGGPLATRDSLTREAIGASVDLVDAAGVTNRLVTDIACRQVAEVVADAQIGR